MAQQLQYTSAPRGLMPGAAGFCTVKQTVGMTARLRKTLEGISSYRHVFPIHDPNAAQNPVDYRHIIAREGTQQLFILSKTCNAGAEHTGRSNFYASHLVLSSEERHGKSPTQILASAAFAPTWDGQVQETAPPTNFVGPNESCRVCQGWNNVAGDAGWAGVVAENVSRGKNTVVAFQPSMNLFQMMSEACGLLEPADQWKFTFSTYYTGLPNAYDCKVRCVVAGSPEHLAAKNSSTELIDLTQPRPTTSTSTWVDMARQGRRPLAAVSMQPASERAPTVTRAVPPQGNTPRPQSAPGAPPLQPVELPKSPVANSPPEFHSPAVKSPPAPATSKEPSRWGTMLALLGGMVAGVVAAGAALGLLMLHYRSENAQTIATIEKLTQQHSVTIPENLGSVSPTEKLELLERHLVADLGDRRKDVDGLKSKLNETTTAKDKRIDELTRQVKQEESKHERLKSDATKYQTKLTTLRGELEKAGNENQVRDALKRFLKDESKESKRYVEVALVAQQLAESKSQLATAQSDLAALRKKLKTQSEAPVAAKSSASKQEGAFIGMLPSRVLSPPADQPPPQHTIRLKVTQKPIAINLSNGTGEPADLHVRKSGANYQLWWRKLRLFSFEFSRGDDGQTFATMYWDPNGDDTVSEIRDRKKEILASWKSMRMFGFVEDGKLGKFEEIKPTTNQMNVNDQAEAGQ